MKSVSVMLLLAATTVWAEENLSLNVDAIKQDLANVQQGQMSEKDKQKSCDKIKSNLKEFTRHKTETDRGIKQFKCDSAPFAAHVDWCKFQLDTVKILDFGIGEAESGIENHCSAAG